MEINYSESEIVADSIVVLEFVVAVAASVEMTDLAATD